MNKYFIAFCAIGIMFVATIFAQDGNLDLFNQIDQSDTTKTPTPAPNSAAQGEPTIITATKESEFRSKEKMAIFKGDVVVKSPQFNLKADMLTVYFNKSSAAAGAGTDSKKTPAAKPAETPKADAAAPPPGQGGIERAIAEGNVVIESDRPDANGGPPVHYVGTGRKVVYTAATGEAVLSGSPRVDQGVNSMVATEDSTVIYLYRDGRMHAEGGHKMEIHDPGPDKKSPTPAPQTEVK
jgi:lipopolysaccharide export system protein LptA